MGVIRRLRKLFFGYGYKNSGYNPQQPGKTYNRGGCAQKRYYPIFVLYGEYAADDAQNIAEQTYNPETGKSPEISDDGDGSCNLRIEAGIDDECC